jgi:hypothetical protein
VLELTEHNKYGRRRCCFAGYIFAVGSDFQKQISAAVSCLGKWVAILGHKKHYETIGKSFIKAARIAWEEAKPAITLQTSQPMKL